jgi:hypothetical protein
MSCMVARLGLMHLTTDAWTRLNEHVSLFYFQTLELKVLWQSQEVDVNTQS